MLHISPESYSRGEVLPHSLIFPYTFFALFDKRLNSVFLDLILSIKPQLLLNFQFYRKSMSIPTCLSWNHVALHCPISWNHILDNSGKYMSDMRLSVGCWRSVVKSICWSLFTVFHAFFKNVIVFPKLFNLFFPVYKVQVRIYFLIHRISSFCSSLRNV